MSSSAKKAALPFLAALFILGGIFAMLTANHIKKENAPRPVYIDGRLEGYMGGNSEVDSEMDALTALGVIISGVGVVTFMISRKVKSDSADY